MSALLVIHPKLDTYHRRSRRRKLREIHGDLCCWCARPMDFEQRTGWLATIEHIVPRREGGSNDLTNLRLAHYVCNAARDQGAKAARLRYWIRDRIKSA